MRIGLSLPHYGFSLPDGEPLTVEACAAWAARAEALGFDSVWVSDHLFYSFGRYGADPTPIASLEPLTTLAAIATRTQRVRLGTLVLCAPFRHPGVLAKAAATLDLLSTGRLDLGVGAGWLREEFEAFGIGFGSIGERFDALEDTVTALAALLGQERPVDVDGHGVSIHAASLLRPVQRPIPLWLGGKGGPRLLRLAARHGAGWNVVWRITPEGYAATHGSVRAACEAVGRDPATFRRSVGLYGLVGADDVQARATFERARDSFPGGAMASDTWESWSADTLSGSPARILERIEAFDALGVDELIWAPWVLPFAIPEPDQVERFAAEVLGPLHAGA
jgi:probable F420-dependent oxidoreductase